MLKLEGLLRMQEIREESSKPVDPRMKV